MAAVAEKFNKRLELAYEAMQVSILWQILYGEEIHNKFYCKKTFSNYIIYHNHRAVYHESIQHVEAAAKLLRIPPALWLVFAATILN